jgi:fumarate hydratase subunit beta
MTSGVKRNMDGNKACENGVVLQNGLKPPIKMQMPMTKEDIRFLQIGDIVELSGDIYTSRDAANKRIQMILKTVGKLPVDFKNQFIFYAGPCPQKREG